MLDLRPLTSDLTHCPEAELCKLIKRKSTFFSPQHEFAAFAYNLAHKSQHTEHSRSGVHYNRSKNFDKRPNRRQKILRRRKIVAK